MSHWIIQDKVFGEETDRLIEALKNANVGHSIVAGPAEVDYSGHVFFRGSIDFVETCRSRIERWRCLDWKVENFSCSDYYPLFGAHCWLLNYDAVWMPWRYFKLHGDLLFDRFGCDKLFIRPDSGRKIFTGTTIGKKWFFKEAEVIEGLPSTKDLNDNTMILVAKAKNIEKEARFLLGPTGVISCSWYNGAGSQREMDIMAQDAMEAYSYHFGTFMTVDMCYLKDEIMPNIVEVNSFESAGLYDMDMNKVVEAVEQYVRIK
jgi:hypothetical protein